MTTDAPASHVECCNCKHQWTTEPKRMTFRRTVGLWFVVCPSCGYGNQYCPDVLRQHERKES